MSLVPVSSPTPAWASGETWSPHLAAEPNGWYSVAYANGVWVAVAESGTNQMMRSLDDGVITAVSENVVGSGPAELASTGVTSSSLPWWAIITVFGGLMFIVYSRRAVKMAERAQPSSH